MLAIAARVSGPDEPSPKAVLTRDAANRNGRQHLAKTPAGTMADVAE